MSAEYDDTPLYKRPLARGQEVQYQMRGCGLIEKGMVIDAGYHVILVESPEKGVHRFIFYDEIIKTERFGSTGGS
jgi:hypothetical protein